MRWVVVVLLVALAGCGESTVVPPGIPVDEHGEALPNLEGFVVDEAIRPMAGVLVRILFSDVNATTDDQGYYAIRRQTFVAENVLLSASAPGYVPLSHQVQVSGHRSTRMDFQLEPDPYAVARVDVLNQRGSLGCQVRSPLLPGNGTTCDAPSISIDGLGHTDDAFIWQIDTTVGLAGAVLELYWDPETALSNELHALLRGPVVGCCEEDPDSGSKGEVHADVAGPSPLRLELTEAVARAFPRWSGLMLEVRLPDGAGAEPVGVSRAQTIDAYASIFYVDPAPPGYTLA